MGHTHVLFTIIIIVITSCYNCNGQLRDVKATLESFTEFSEFRKIFYKSQMMGNYAGSRRMTLFAFNNSAWNLLPLSRRSKLQSFTQKQAATFIQAHTVYSEDFKTSEMNGVNVRKNSMNGLPIFINKRTQTDFTFQGTYGVTLYYVNGAEINNNYKDIQCNNGYLHSLMDVMHVPSGDTAFQYIQRPTDTNVRSTQFFNLVNLLQGDYFDPVYHLNQAENMVTFFVPSDAAISRIPIDKRSQLQGDKSKLQQIVYAHYIQNIVMFTEPASHNQGFNDGNKNTNQQNRITFRKPNFDSVFVNSLGVNARITYGNVTVRNGVIHVIDKLLGFVYYTVREEISKTANTFEQLFNKGDPELAKSLTDQSAVTVFAPTNEAFQKIANLPWVNLNMMNQTLVNMILRLHMVYQGRSVEVSSLTGAYESRQYVESQDFGAMLSVYNERNESWVQGGPRGEGGVRAKILSPDVACTNGKVNYIDAVLGVPYLDLPMLICSDLWLLKTYDHIKTLGMTNYLKDRRFEAEKCYFETYGYPPNWGSNNQYFTTTPYYPVWNPYSSTTPRTGALNTVAHNMGFCGQNRVGCQFTFFVPNSTAIDKFQFRREGQIIMQDYPRFQFIMRRLIIPNRKIRLSDLADGSTQDLTAHNGDYISIRKSGTRNYELMYKQSRATVIHADQAATNGIMHIISDILYDRSDLDRDVSAAAGVTMNVFLTVFMLILSTILLTRRRFFVHN